MASAIIGCYSTPLFIHCAFKHSCAYRHVRSRYRRLEATLRSPPPATDRVYGTEPAMLFNGRLKCRVQFELRAKKDQFGEVQAVTLNR